MILVTVSCGLYDELRGLDDEDDDEVVVEINDDDEEEDSDDGDDDDDDDDDDEDEVLDEDVLGDLLDNRGSEEAVDDIILDVAGDKEKLDEDVILEVCVNDLIEELTTSELDEYSEKNEAEAKLVELGIELDCNGEMNEESCDVLADELITVFELRM